MGDHLVVEPGIGFSSSSASWSLTGRARGLAGNSVEEKSDALAEFLYRYWPTLRAHLVWRRIAADKIDDLLQQFVADRIIERDLLARANRERGSLRAFLVASLDHFVANQNRRERARRRRPRGGALLSLESTAAASQLDAAAAHPLCRGPDPDPFDVEWAREALAEALRRMHAGCVADARDDLWTVFQSRILRPSLEDLEPVPYETLAAQCGYHSWKQVANALVTSKRRFEQSLRGVLAEHLDDEAEVSHELAALETALASAGHAA